MKLTFIMGGKIRRVFVKDRVVTLISAELNFTPLSFDLNKLESVDMKDKFSKMKNPEGTKKMLSDLAQLQTEKDIVYDVKRDFQRQGWRCVKIEK